MSKFLKFCFNSAKHPSDKWEPYFAVYHRHLESYSHSAVNLVEVGVQKGGSLDMWSTYFRHPATTITGIDVDPECSNLVYDDRRVSVVIGDQGKAEFWDEYLKKSDKIDVFIDDGGHFMDQQILTFEKVFPKLSLGGVYICEDCHTSYMSYNGGGLNRPTSFIEYAKSYVDVIHWEWKEQYNTELERRWKIGKDLTSVHFYDSMVVFEKHGKKEMRRVKPEL